MSRPAKELDFLEGDWYPEGYEVLVEEKEDGQRRPRKPPTWEELGRWDVWMMQQLGFVR